jgi:L-malate glycosyltransferase
VWLLARALARLGAEQVVVTGTGTELANRLQSSGVAVRLASWVAGLDPRVIWSLLSEVHNSPALLHAHDSHALTLAGICAGLTRVPLIGTRRVDFHLRRRGLWHRADHIIAISGAVARVLADDGIQPERITVVHSGIDLDLIRQTPRLGIRDRLGLPRGARVAVNVAALVPHKDHATLIKAAHRLVARQPDLHWAIAGDGPLKDQIQAQVRSLRLGECVHLIGHIDQPERLIADADLFVMSSREEGLGTAVLDAMGLGIPIAATTAGGLPEMLNRGAGVLVRPEDPAALADAVTSILDSPALARALSLRAGEEVVRFTDSRMAEEVRQVYRSFAHSLDGT